MNGWINAYKERGISSFNLVSRVKNALGNVKIGHAGTLDVEAEGVLPIAVGEATKLIQYLVDCKKKYIFSVKFGAQTTTGDFSGETTLVSNYIPNQLECESVCDKFHGIIKQTPPAFSALKVNGVRAYKLARAGVDVELKPRYIEIFSLKCLHYNAQDGVATYVTECSKGTYIRSLAQDIALSLQSLGFVVELRRTQVGIFHERDSLRIPAPVALVDCLIEPEVVIAHLPVIDCDDFVSQKIRFGQRCYIATCYDNYANSDVWIRARGRLLAIGNADSENYFRVKRVFNLI